MCKGFHPTVDTWAWNSLMKKTENAEEEKGRVRKEEGGKERKKEEEGGRDGGEEAQET